MIPYNRKMFADELNRLRTYCEDKLPVNFEEILTSCPEKAFGKQPGHTKFNIRNIMSYGELWLRIEGRKSYQI